MRLRGIGGGHGGRGGGGAWRALRRRLGDGPTLNLGTLPVADLGCWRAHSSGAGSTAGMRRLLSRSASFGVYEEEAGRESNGERVGAADPGKWPADSVRGWWPDGESGKA